MNKYMFLNFVALSVLFNVLFVSAASGGGMRKPFVTHRKKILTGEEEAVFAAVKAGTIETVSTSISTNPDLVHAKDTDGCTLIYYAVCDGQPNMVAYLLGKGASPAESYRYGKKKLSLLEIAQFKCSEQCGVLLKDSQTIVQWLLHFTVGDGLGQDSETLDKQEKEVARLMVAAKSTYKKKERRVRRRA